MRDGFVKVAAASPALKVADCAYNAAEIVKTAWRASVEQVKVLVLPELAITGYTCGDLFGQQLLIGQALEALGTIAAETSDLDLLLFVGLPVLHKGKLYNCAAALHHGALLGLVPKTHLPNYGEFYEARQFTPAFTDIDTFSKDTFQDIPIGRNLLFQCDDLPELIIAVEICEDLWAPQPPSIAHAVAGATLLCNLSASDETVGKAEYRKSLVAGQSARLVCGYLYADAGAGESTTDMVFAGHNLIAENGGLLAEAALFSGEMAAAEVDVQRLIAERRRLTTFPPAGDEHYLTIPFAYANIEIQPLERKFSPTPFVPANDADLSGRCETILNIQAGGLCKRLAHTGIQKSVLGISGGLDSTLALLVVARAYQQLGLPAEDIIAVTMPGFGTTQRTKGNAEKLCGALGVSLKTVDITAGVTQHFKDIGHDPADHNTVYENSQARMRTMILMDIANGEGGLVVGTGDLSELALGWATYNGDHMSMYGVNASVPKTLVRHIVRYEAERRPDLTDVLLDILETPVSPELLPTEGGETSQHTESILGPYEVHDFILYYMLRWGFAPEKIFRLLGHAFAGQYEGRELLTWMRTFYRRFFAQQFKRSCLPDGPKVGSVSLSPRGDWRMPSDASAALWLAQIDQIEKSLVKSEDNTRRF